MIDEGVAFLGVLKSQSSEGIVNGIISLKHKAFYSIIPMIATLLNKSSKALQIRPETYSIMISICTVHKAIQASLP